MLKGIRAFYFLTALFIMVGCHKSTPTDTPGMQIIRKAYGRVAAPKTARSLETFKSLTRNMNMVDVVKQCGLPDEEAGSGLSYFIYYLQDGSEVAIANDGQKLFNIIYRDPSGKSSYLWSEEGL